MACAVAGALLAPARSAAPPAARHPSPEVPPGKPPPLEDGPDGVPIPRSPEASADSGSISGTGFVVADRRLLTNRHVVAGCKRIVARDPAGVELPAKLIAADRSRDLALLSTERPVGPPLTFRDGPPVRRGESVTTYGFPLLGLLSSGPTLTTGNVNALTGLRDNPTNFQISAAVQPGSSGGPLFDGQGHVVGVVVSQLNAARVAEMTGGDLPQNVNFAVKGSEALAFLAAHDVRPLMAPSTGPDKRPDEIDAVANPSTVYLQCFR
ncbi:MAG: serine protease [Acetobacteraceae bacterium]|nr:serine protease [Acetobacteraceae bacterium]